MIPNEGMGLCLHKSHPRTPCPSETRVSQNSVSALLKGADLGRQFLKELITAKMSTFLFGATAFDNANQSSFVSNTPHYIQFPALRPI